MVQGLWGMVCVLGILLGKVSIGHGLNHVL